MKRFIYLGFILIILSACTSKAKEQSYTSVLEGQSIYVPSLTGGIIKQVLVQEGDWIEAGDTLAILDTREISYQMEQLDAQIMELNIQTQISETTMKQAETDFEHIQEKYSRIKALYEQSVIPRQDFDDANNLANKSNTMLSNAKNQHILMTASKDKLLAQRKILHKKATDAIIISSATGSLSTLYYHAGEAIMPYGNLLQIMDTRHLDTKIYVSEETLNQIAIGDSVSLKTSSGYSEGGRIIQISNKAEFTPKNILTPDTRAAMVYAVTIRIPNPESKLKDGMPVEIVLP